MPVSVERGYQLPINSRTHFPPLILICLVASQGLRIPQDEGLKGWRRSTSIHNCFNICIFAESVGMLGAKFHIEVNLGYQ